MTNDAPDYISARQRARNNTSGVNASRVMRGQAPVGADAEVQPNTGRRHGNPPRNNYASPTEFFSGPRQPPRQSSGIRRNPEANRDTVGLMLTDEYLMTGNGANAGHNARGGAGGAGAGGAAHGAKSRGAAAQNAPAQQAAAPASGAQSYGAAAKRGQGATRARDAHNANRAAQHSATRTPGGYREGLTYNCIVTAPEAEWHSGVKITHPQGPMDTPYFEDNDPRPPRDTPAVTGKRHVRPPCKDAKMFGQVPPPKEGEEEANIQSSLPPCRKTSNKANESVDVLNLYWYSPEELSEKPQPYKQLGPRKYVAPDMPPRKPPMIHPINTKAKQEHDVLGTGRCGVPEKEQHRGLGRGSCRPPRDTANLFRGGVAPAEDREQQQQQQPQSRQSSRRPTEEPSQQRRESRQVEPFRANSRSASPKKRPDPVFTDADRPHKILSKKNAGSPDLLRYYDPNVDPKPAPSPTKHNGQRANQQSREPNPADMRPSGRGRGEFSRNNRDSVVLSYA